MSYNEFCNEQRIQGHANNPKDVPNVPHWVVITGTQIHVPGDDRSRVSPGHGYPATTEYFIKYAYFTNEDAWKKYIANNVLLNTVMFVGKMIPAKATTSVVVTTEFCESV